MKQLLKNTIYMYADSVESSTLHKRRLPKDFKDRIDRIDEILVASLRVQKIFLDVKKSRQARCLHIPISWILGDGPHAKLNTEKERKAYQQKKGVTKGLRPPTSMVSAVIRKIAEDSKLFDLRTKDTGRIPNSHAGAFFVMKTNNKLRVIVDGRVLNSFFNGSLAKFSLFTLESLKPVIDNLSANRRRRSRDHVMRQGRWYAINLDLRHWFHQIPLPWRYQRYMFIHMTDRDNRNKERFQELFRWVGFRRRSSRNAAPRMRSSSPTVVKTAKSTPTLISRLNS